MLPQQHEVFFWEQPVGFAKEEVTAGESTHNRRSVFDFFYEGIRRESRTPAVLEVADCFDYAKLKAASDYLLALENKGWISRRMANSRNIEVAGKLDSHGIPVIRRVESDNLVLTPGKAEARDLHSLR